MDELLLIDDLDILVEDTADNIETLESIIESYDAKIQELFDKEQQLLAEGASEVAVECWWANEASENPYMGKSGVDFFKTCHDQMAKWYKSTKVGKIQEVIEDTENLKIIRANAKKKFSKKFKVHTLYGKPLFDHINLFTSFIATPLKNILGQFEHFFGAFTASRARIQSGELFNDAIRNNSFGTTEIGQSFISSHIDEIINFLGFDWLKLDRMYIGAMDELTKQVELQIEAKFKGAMLATYPIWRIQVERFIIAMHRQQLDAIRENMQTAHDICVFLLKLKDGKNESYELEDAELLDLDII